MVCAVLWSHLQYQLCNLTLVYSVILSYLQYQLCESGLCCSLVTFTVSYVQSVLFFGHIYSINCAVCAVLWSHLQYQLCSPTMVCAVLWSHLQYYMCTLCCSLVTFTASTVYSDHGLCCSFKVIVKKSLSLTSGCKRGCIWGTYSPRFGIWQLCLESPRRGSSTRNRKSSELGR